MRRFTVVVAFSLVCAFGASVYAQQDVRYQEDPTKGLHLPGVTLAGEHDATSTTMNPAGVGLLTGTSFALAFDLARDEGAVRSGPGAGFYAASSFGGALLPKLGWGASLEWLRPHRSSLLPDPGSATRMTQSVSLPAGNFAMGVSWHHYWDDGGVLDGADTYDLGWTTRYGKHWAAGLVIRDINAPTLGDTKVQRRYELEVVSRPTGSDRLELAIGGRVREDDVDFGEGHGLDGWLKWSLKVMTGFYVRGEAGSQSLHRVTSVASGDPLMDFERDVQISVGLDVSFGAMATALYATGVRDAQGDVRGTGGTLVARFGTPHIPSVLPAPKRMERLELKGAISERKLTAVSAYLQRIAEDEDVVGLFVSFDGVTGGWGSLHELRRELLRVHDANKKVFAFLVASSTGEYFVASAADKVYVDPAGGIRLQGMASTSLYFKGLFEKLGVTAQFERIEEYKSAPEAYTRTGPTGPALRMRNELYDDLYETLVGEMARSRNVSPERMRTLIDNGPYTAGDLEQISDLVDGVTEPDDLTELVAAEMGGYYPFRSETNTRDEVWSRPAIAVIYIEGDIIGGESKVLPVLNRRLVGGETIAKAIASAREDSSVKAIVLRINSPGGSALASEIMAREVMKTRGVKPIVCSMGDMAASGGYFAAAGCDRIFADEMTITGSIGIFNGSFDIGKLLSSLGLSWATYGRGKRANMDSMYRPMTTKERALMKSKLRYFYNRFLETVAKGRNMTPKEVDDVGRGHVWTGKQGRNVRLVDELGGLMDAIGYAKRKAGFAPGEKATLSLLPKEEKGFLSRVVGAPFAATQSVESHLQVLGPLLQSLPGTSGGGLLEALPASIWTEPGVPQARLPFAIIWE